MNDVGKRQAALYQAHYPQLLAYLTQLLGDRSAAEDIAQEAGIRLLATADDREPLRNPRAFLFHVATNLARDVLRRQLVRGSAAELDETSLTDVAADVVAQARQEVEQVQSALRELPERPREVLWLSRVDGLSHGEIGARLGITAKTVENHLARALKMLLERVGRGGRRHD